MKNKGARVVTTLYSYIKDAQLQLTLSLVVRCGDIYLMQTAMCVLDTCKTEEGPFKNDGARVVIKISPIVCLCRFFMVLKGSLMLVLLKVQTHLSFYD